MQVEVIVFEDYEIIRDKTTQADFIFPVGKPRRKVLELKDIRKAFNRFINIKTNKDAIRFARKYGLLNGYEAYITLLAPYPEIEKTLRIEGYKSKLVVRHAEFLDESLFSVVLETKQDIIAFKLPDGNIAVENMVYGKQRIISNALCEPYYISGFDCYGFYIDKFLEDPENGSIFSVFGEFFDFKNDKLDKIIEEIAKEYREVIKGSGWKYYIDYFNKKAKAFLQKDNIEFDNTDEKIDEVLKDYMGEPKEKDVKLQYTIRKARKKGRPGERYFVETSIKFNSLLDAFDALWFFAGGALKQCVICGRIFVAERSTAKYCSESCKKKAHSARKSH